VSEVVSIDTARYAVFKFQKQRYSKDLLRHFFPLFSAIFGEEGKGLCAIKRSILCFILRLTYGSGREGAQVYGYQFEKGVVKRGTSELITSGLGMNVRTRKKHMMELVAQGFLTIYVARNEGQEHESDARIFEINCKKLGVEGVQIYTPPGCKTAPHHRDINRIAKAIHPADGGSGRVEEFNDGDTDMLKEPKKGRWQAPAQAESGATVVQRVQATAIARVTRRVESAQAKAPHQLSTEELQALLDSTMRQYAPNAQRVMVTQREHGSWRKRLRENPPADFGDFLSWTVRNWGEVSSQSRKAMKRRAETGQTVRGTPIPMAPSFSTLVYRYPYFLAAYASFKAERTTGMREEADDKRVKSLEAQVAAHKRDVQVLRKALNTRTVRPSVEKPNLQVVKRAEPVSLDGGDLAPWVDAETDEYAKRA
jgi:hypothetical protein